MTNPLTFNLLDEPWVPVVDKDGFELEVSIRDAILKAQHFRDLGGELPTVRFSVLRILLAIVYRALDQKPTRYAAESWGELWNQPTLPVEPFEQYFSEWHHRFDLLDAADPFMQTPTLRTAKDEWKPVSLIVADSDPDRALFTMRSELQSIGFAEATRWLVHAHAYDYSGIKSGAVGDDRVKGGKGYPMGLGWAGWLGGVSLVGTDLRETLLLNFIRNRTATQKSDLPIWEHPTIGPGIRTNDEIGPIGPLSLMTWSQRRIRLRVEDDRVNGVLVTNGDPVEYTIRQTDEPMSSWRFSEPQSVKAKSTRFMPRKLEPGRTLWRGLSTLLPTADSAKPSPAVANKWKIAQSAEPAQLLDWLGELVREKVLPVDKIVEVSAVSMDYGTQNASFAEVVSDRLAIAAALADLNKHPGLLRIAESAVSRTDSAIRALGQLASNIDRAAGGNGDGAYADTVADAYSAMNLEFRQWLIQVLPEADGARLLQDWTESVRRTIRMRAEQLVESAPNTAWIGRSDNGTEISIATAMRWFDSAIYRALGAPPVRTINEATTETIDSNSDQTIETEIAR
ncbi:MAG: type I-E CRISPR-associated protein Cse1/CasA [Gulosibacter sp.]|uniref:type I-E CRISPR-associated protein Cse1/CasA n=1 Tax=Gulosibacter sp. TaxID=2817531 RepID=UPI003F8F8225